MPSLNWDGRHWADDVALLGHLMVQPWNDQLVSKHGCIDQSTGLKHFQHVESVTHLSSAKGGAKAAQAGDPARERR